MRRWTIWNISTFHHLNLRSTKGSKECVHWTSSWYIQEVATYEMLSVQCHVTYNLVQNQADARWIPARNEQSAATAISWLMQAKSCNTVTGNNQIVTSCKLTMVFGRRNWDWCQVTQPIALILKSAVFAIERTVRTYSPYAILVLLHCNVRSVNLLQTSILLTSRQSIDSASFLRSHWHKSRQPAQWTWA